MITNEILLGGGTWQEALMASLKDLIDAALAKAKLDAHPVGSYYWSSEATDPGTLFGGTWEQIKDRFVYAAGDGSAAGDTGGEATHTLTEAEMPAHTHTRGTMNITGGATSCFLWNESSSATEQSGALSMAVGANGEFFYPTGWADNTAGRRPGWMTLDASRSWTGATSSVGGGAAHNNLPPYVRAYCWRRTA